MNLIKFYFRTAVIIGLLEVIDGILLVVNNGKIIWFNLLVSVIELYWIPVALLMVFIARRNRLIIISPLSYVLYHVLGIFITNLLPMPEGATNTVPFWLGVVGTIFGSYYLSLNDIFSIRIKEQQGG